MKNRLVYNPIKNSSGFIVADFLFAFVMVLGIGIFIFGFTFSLATVEISQYIVWSTARNYSAANTDESEAKAKAQLKFQNLTARFPLLTGNGSSDPWFELNDLKVGDLSSGIDPDFSSKIGADKDNSFRQPWHGASAVLNLKLFAGFQIPFLGKVAKDKDDFKFPIRAFILRHPSKAECLNFFNRDRYLIGIKNLEGGKLADDPTNTTLVDSPPVEDNGC
jgi:hypothetical protein